MANISQTLSKGQREEVCKIFRNRIIAALTVLALITGFGLWQIMLEVKQEMKSLVVEQFKEPRIQQTVQEVAANQAATLMSKQIVPEVTKFKSKINSVSNEMGAKVDQLEKVLSESRIVLDEVKSTSDFALLLTKASNDDRDSFEALRKIADTKGDKFQQIAYQALVQIVTDIQNVFEIQSSIDWQKEYNIDPAKASLADFVNVYPKALPVFQPKILQTIWEQERFSKTEKLEMLYAVIATTKSLKTLRTACKLMNEEAKLDRNIIAYKQYSIWWEENKKNYNQNPENQLTDLPAKKQSAIDGPRR